MAKRIFIDGEAGTTGLEIRARLEGRAGIELLAIDAARRKDADARKRLLNEADGVVLCLPDDAAVDAVSLIENGAVKVVDASSAHRTDKGWVFGFAEMVPGQAERIAEATRVSNPGCYPTGFIGLVRPLVDAGLLPAETPLTVNAVSGYSGGGRKMIEAYERKDNPDYVDSPHRVYGLGLEHKHTDEMRVHGGLTHRPLFVPSVGRFRAGMIVQVPLQLWALPGRPAPADLHDALSDAYAGKPFVTVMPLAPDGEGTRQLDAEGLNGSNRLDLHVFANAARGQAVLAAVLDNLGKGAAGQAVQNLNLMLGLGEGEGLD